MERDNLIGEYISATSSSIRNLVEDQSKKPP